MFKDLAEEGPTKKVKYFHLLEDMFDDAKSGSHLKGEDPSSSFTSLAANAQTIPAEDIDNIPIQTSESRSVDTPPSTQENIVPSDSIEDALSEEDEGARDLSESSRPKEDEGARDLSESSRPKEDEGTMKIQTAALEESRLQVNMALFDEKNKASESAETDFEKLLKSKQEEIDSLTKQSESLTKQNESLNSFGEDVGKIGATTQALFGPLSNVNNKLPEDQLTKSMKRPAEQSKANPTKKPKAASPSTAGFAPSVDGIMHYMNELMRLLTKASSSHVTECTQLRDERDAALAERDAALAERDAALAERDAERDAALRRADELESRLRALTEKMSDTGNILVNETSESPSVDTPYTRENIILNNMHMLLREQLSHVEALLHINNGRTKQSAEREELKEKITRKNVEYCLCLEKHGMLNKNQEYDDEQERQNMTPTKRGRAPSSNSDGETTPSMSSSSLKRRRLEEERR